MLITLHIIVDYVQRMDDVTLDYHNPIVYRNS